ncbi:hypothetical protein [Tychonema sp. BBK16]|uniref:hypothetical protein n=1 Tax=Tychonema sp. BBK16 TaxID=2699888 RepID=UPI001F439015|nr:hypothetical protein [Tychonema sp. BBK16]MCF6372992.1 hypothetical protein [Tychonema sp. BBK16]
MEDWSKELFEVMENAASEVEHFFSDMNEEFAEMVDVLAKMSEEFTEQIQNNLINDIDGYFSEFDGYLNELIEPIIEVYRDFDSNIGDIDSSFVTYVDPSPTQQPACRGCSNYHGQVYGGNLLVCAMHPTGVESESCADWEADSDLNF